jgi:hypothetical protein
MEVPPRLGTVARNKRACWQGRISRVNRLRGCHPSNQTRARLARLGVAARRAGREAPGRRQVDECVDVGASVCGRRRLIGSVDSEAWTNVKVKDACAWPGMGCLTTRRRTVGRLQLIIAANASWVVKYTANVLQATKLPPNSATFYTCPPRWLLLCVGVRGRLWGLGWRGRNCRLCMRKIQVWLVR